MRFEIRAHGARWQGTGCELRTTDYRLLRYGNKVQAIGCRELRFANYDYYRLPTTDYGLPAPDYRLLTTNYQLLTT
ncbi:MAG: hypothetical protein EOO01_29950 [Chitinophagaceae bacterium]|nr:MAG: hypothetical protein EOO01_29950 [Chitinophagaceae bacterium]